MLHSVKLTNRWNRDNMKRATGAVVWRKGPHHHAHAGATHARLAACMCMHRKRSPSTLTLFQLQLWWAHFYATRSPVRTLCDARSVARAARQCMGVPRGQRCEPPAAHALQRASADCRCHRCQRRIPADLRQRTSHRAGAAPQPWLHELPRTPRHVAQTWPRPFCCLRALRVACKAVAVRESSSTRYAW
jgi:hypothetical protein